MCDVKISFYLFFLSDIQNKSDQDYYQEECKDHYQDMGMAYNRWKCLLKDTHNIHDYTIHNYFQQYYVDKYIDL